MPASPADSGPAPQPASSTARSPTESTGPSARPKPANASAHSRSPHQHQAIRRLSMAPSPASNVPQLLLKVEEAAERLRICRSSMYKLISSGEVESVQIGRLRRIKPSALEDYIQHLDAGHGK